MKRSSLIVVLLASLVFLVSIAVPALGGPRTLSAASAVSTAQKALKLATTADKNAKKALKQGGPRGPQGPIGPSGAAGANGAQGPAGPSEAVTRFGATNVTIVGSGDVQTLNLAAGSWIVFSRVDGAHLAGASPARFECSLLDPSGGTMDFSKLRLQANDGSANPLIFASIEMHGPVTLSAPGTIRTLCGTNPTSDVGFEITTRRMTAIRVGSITTQ